MHYTDDELARWWERLPIYARETIFDTIEGKALSEFFRNKADGIRERYAQGKKLTGQELDILRKWQPL